MAVTRRKFLVGAAATAVGGFALMQMKESETPPITDEKAVETFNEGKQYWDVITRDKPDSIPVEERVALGRIMNEIKHKLPIQFAQEHGGVSYDAVTRLKSPNAIATEAFVPVADMGIYFIGDERDEFDIVKGQAERMFRQTLVGGRDRLISGPPDYMVICALEAAEKTFITASDRLVGFYGADNSVIEAEKTFNSGSDSLEAKGKVSNAFEEAAKSLRREKQLYIDGEKSAEDTISDEKQKEYLDLMTAKLAYCIRYYFPESKKTLLGGKLKRINLHYGFLRDPALERSRIYGKDPFSNRFADWEYLNMRGGGYEPHRMYLSLPIRKIDGNLNKPIKEEHGSLMHELGHIIPLVIKRQFRSQMDGAVKELLSLDIKEYTVIFSTDYGHTKFQTGGSEYSPQEETRANLYTLCSEGMDFPKQARKRMEDRHIEKTSIEKAYHALNTFQSLLVKNGYNGNPDWTK